MVAREIRCEAPTHKPKLFAVVHPDGWIEIKHRSEHQWLKGATVMRVYCPLCKTHRELRI